VRVDSGEIIYYLQYFADQESISIIDFETGLVSSVKRHVKDQGVEEDAVGLQSDQIKSIMPGTV